MHDIAWRSILRWAVLVPLWLSGCSDDGLTPPAVAGSSGGGTGGDSAATSSVNTSATVTASGSGDGGQEDAPTGTSGEDESGGPPPDESTGGDTGPEAGSESGEGGSSSGGEPDCVASDDCECDPSDVLCEAVPPACPPDTVPQIDPATMCWTFACVPAESCQTVPDCTVCAEDQACIVRSDLGGLSFVCEPIPPACMEVPTCMCMPDACPMPFECMGPPPKGIADLGCACEAC